MDITIHIIIAGLLMTGLYIVYLGSEDEIERDFEE